MKAKRILLVGTIQPLDVAKNILAEHGYDCFRMKEIKAVTPPEPGQNFQLIILEFKAGSDFMGLLHEVLFLNMKIVKTPILIITEKKLEDLTKVENALMNTHRQLKCLAAPFESSEAVLRLVVKMTTTRWEKIKLFFSRKK
jgi:hypothetical protein